MRFSIVTPVLNGARFIDETILSVVSQAGDFAVSYHVQDGCSTDETLAKLQHWNALLNGGFPILCKSLRFTYSTERDRGVYDAINRAFDHCDDGDIMSWINADDRYEPGAFGVVASVLKQFPDVAWLTGRAALLNEDGGVSVRPSLTSFPRKAIAAGVFDSRYSPYVVQQEGTFWRRDLWAAVGPLDPSFRASGDFDLWRRFARRADLVMVDSVLGQWRRRAGQISENIAAYCAEIDARMTEDEKQQRQRAALDQKRFWARWSRRSEYGYRVLRRSAAGQWVCEKYPLRAMERLWAARQMMAPAFSVRRIGARLIARMSARKMI